MLKTLIDPQWTLFCVPHFVPHLGGDSTFGGGGSTFGRLGPLALNASTGSSLVVPHRALYSTGCCGSGCPDQPLVLPQMGRSGTAQSPNVEPSRFECGSPTEAQVRGGDRWGWSGRASGCQGAGGVFPRWDWQGWCRSARFRGGCRCVFGERECVSVLLGCGLRPGQPLRWFEQRPVLK